MLLLTTSAGAQAPAGAPAAGGKPRALAGRCGSANWVCVAQCIDTSCVDRCLAEGCEKALDSLTRCAARSGCGADDSACVDRKCGKQCDRTFEPAPPSPESEQSDPCADGSVGAGEVPRELVGDWSLEAASLRPGERDKLAQSNEGQDVKPRPDYERALVVTPGGCFLLSTKLEDATLGRGNSLQVRSWGAFQVDTKKDTVRMVTKSGQAVGPVCGKPRVVGLSKGKFRQPVYQYELDRDTLSLTSEGPSKQTFQFRRASPPKAE